MSLARRQIPGAWLIGAVLAFASAVPANAEVVEVNIDKLAFSPAQISAHIGDTVEWTNADFVAHTATARNHDWDVVIPPGKTAHVVINKAVGRIDYFCRFHPNMTGQINVTTK